MRLQSGRPGFDPWVGKIPWRQKRLPTRVFWPSLEKGQTRLSMSWDSVRGGGLGAEMAVICVPNGTHSLEFDALLLPLVSVPRSFTELRAPGPPIPGLTG